MVRWYNAIAKCVSLLRLPDHQSLMTSVTIAHLIIHKKLRS
jgi:hypothetical protein